MLALIWPFRAYSEPDGFASLGNQFVDLLAKGDFAGAVAQFDDAMTAVLPETKLRELWHSLEEQNGPFESRLTTRAVKYEQYNIVLVTCKFERGVFNVKVTFNESRQVAGLYFLKPETPDAPASLPRYAPTNTFHEEPFTVNTGKWKLPGILTIPAGRGDGPWPAVVLVHGSGPEDRDETVGSTKPFRDLAWGLASRGIAVLRFDKRTGIYGEKLSSLIAEGKIKFTVRDETIDDALGAVDELRQTREIDSKRIFVLGHSLGAMLAPRIGQADSQIAGLIMLAALAGPLEDVFVPQYRYLFSLNGDMTREEQQQLDEITAEVARIKGLTPKDSSSTQLLLNAPPSYWLDLRTYNQMGTAQALTQPMLILQGGRDYQVTPDNFDQWKSVLAASTNVTFKFYPKLNHLFVAGDGQSTPSEYDIPGNVDQSVVDDIADWILKTR